MDTLYKTEKHFVESNHVINGYTPLTLSREIDDKLESFISEKRLTDNSEVMINENKLKRALTDYFFQMDFLDYEFSESIRVKFERFHYEYNFTQQMEVNQRHLENLYSRDTLYQMSYELRREFLGISSNDFQTLELNYHGFVYMMIDSITTDKVNKNGRFAKRVQKFIYDNFKVKLSEKQISEVGNLYSQCEYTQEKILYSIQRDIDDLANCGNNSSCWFNGGQYWQSRNYFTASGGFGLVRFDSSNPRYKIGRIWILPVDDFTFLAFNVYEFHNSEVNTVLLDLGIRLFNTSKLTLNKIDLRGCNRDYNTPYINQVSSGKTAYIVTSKDSINNYEVEFIEDLSIYGEDTDEYSCCEICDNRFHNDDLSYIDDRMICDNCINNYYHECHHCNELVHNDDINEYSVTFSNYDKWICDDCFNNHYYKCDNCDEVMPCDEVYNLEDTDSNLCESCYEDEVEKKNKQDEDSQMTFLNNQLEVIPVQ